MEIALRVVQFWSEIELVITNRTPASRLCDFVIMRLISDQIALHSVQLPLFINTSKDLKNKKFCEKQKQMPPRQKASHCLNWVNVFLFIYHLHQLHSGTY